jgi:tRNA(Glu) U13 pseudouridine synthase TruD
MKMMMAAIGLTAASFRVSRLRISSAGGYRKLIAHPKNLSWRLRTLPSLPQTPAIGSSSEQVVVTPDRPERTDSASFCSGEDRLGVEMNFDLAPSMYATMFIREITKNIY